MGAGAALNLLCCVSIVKSPKAKRCLCTESYTSHWLEVTMADGDLSAKSEANALSISTISKLSVFIRVSSFLKGDAEPHKHTQETLLYHGVV